MLDLVAVAELLTGPGGADGLEDRRRGREAAQAFDELVEEGIGDERGVVDPVEPIMVLHGQLELFGGHRGEVSSELFDTSVGHDRTFRVFAGPLVEERRYSCESESCRDRISRATRVRGGRKRATSRPYVRSRGQG